MKAFANGLKRFMAVIFTVVLIADLVPAEALVMNIYATESGSVAAGDTSGDNVDYSDGGSASDNENNDSNTSDSGSSTESENNDSNTSGGGTSSDNGNDSSTTSGEGNVTESNDSNVTNGGDNSGSTTGKDESGTTGKTESGTTGKTESGTDSGSVKAGPTPAVKTPTPKQPILGAPAAGFNASINELAPVGGVTKTKVNDKITIQGLAFEYDRWGKKYGERTFSNNDDVPDLAISKWRGEANKFWFSKDKDYIIMSPEFILWDLSEMNYTSNNASRYCPNGAANMRYLSKGSFGTKKEYHEYFLPLTYLVVVGKPGKTSK